MKLKEGFITQNTDGEQIMVGTGEVQFAGLVRSNKTAAFIVECLKSETTVERIVDEMLEKFDVDRSVVTKDVEAIIVKLQSIGAIEETT